MAHAEIPAGYSPAGDERGFRTGAFFHGRSGLDDLGFRLKCVETSGLLPDRPVRTGVGEMRTWNPVGVRQALVCRGSSGFMPERLRAGPLP